MELKKEYGPNIIRSTWIWPISYGRNEPFKFFKNGTDEQKFLIRTLFILTICKLLWNISKRSSCLFIYWFHTDGVIDWTSRFCPIIRQKFIKIHYANQIFYTCVTAVFVIIVAFCIVNSCNTRSAKKQDLFFTFF